MAKERKRKHPEYYAVKAYQILAKRTDAQMAEELGIALRTYTDKVQGWGDFSPLESRRVCEILQREADELFLL